MNLCSNLNGEDKVFKQLEEAGADVICLLCKTMSAMMFCPYLDKIRQERNEKCKPMRFQSLLLCRLKLAVCLMLHDKVSNI